MSSLRTVHVARVAAIVGCTALAACSGANATLAQRRDEIALNIQFRNASSTTPAQVWVNIETSGSPCPTFDLRVWIQGREMDVHSQGGNDEQGGWTTPSVTVCQPASFHLEGNGARDSLFAPGPVEIVVRDDSSTFRAIANLELSEPKLRFRSPVDGVVRQGQPVELEMEPLPPSHAGMHIWFEGIRWPVLIAEAYEQTDFGVRFTLPFNAEIKGQGTVFVRAPSWFRHELISCDGPVTCHVGGIMGEQSLPVGSIAATLIAD